MKFLTLELIKKQLRIDGVIEDDLLDLYGEAAEETLLNHVGATYEELIETTGEMPKALEQAALMLVDVSYQHRSPISSQSISIVPYTFDILVKPYIRL